MSPDRCQACGRPGDKVMSLPPTPTAPERAVLVCFACFRRLMIYAPTLRNYHQRDRLAGQRKRLVVAR